MGKTNGQVEVFDLLAGETDNRIAVASQAVVYTETFLCEKNVNYSFEYQFDSDAAAVVSCKIELEQGNTPPVTEGSADGNMVIPEDSADFDLVVSDELVHIKAYAPAVSRFLRAKITGLVANTATVKLVRFNVCTIVNL